MLNAVLTELLSLYPLLLGNELKSAAVQCNLEIILHGHCSSKKISVNTNARVCEEDGETVSNMKQSLLLNYFIHFYFTFSTNT